MNSTARIVLLNGVGSAGKGSLAKALQAITKRGEVPQRIDWAFNRIEQRLRPRSGCPLGDWGGGAGRPGSHPKAMTCHPALGAKNALLGRLRRPPDAWMACPPCPAGYRRNDFAAIRTPLSSSVRRGNPRLLPRQVRGRNSEAPALGWSVRHAGRGIGLRPPAPSLRGGPRRPPVSSPRQAHHATDRSPRHHPSTYTMNKDYLSPSARLVADWTFPAELRTCRPFTAARTGGGRCRASSVCR